MMKTIGIDIGTTTISGVVWDGEQQTVEESCTIANNAFLPTEHEWEKIQDAQLVLKRAHGLLDELLDRHPHVDSIGLTGQMHGIVYLGKDGGILSPLYTWQDGRCAVPGENGRALTEEVQESTGLQIHTGYGLATHLWLVRAGEVPEETACLATITDAFGVRLTGRARPLMHAGNAASFGFYDVQEQHFLGEVLEMLGMDCSVLPAVTTEFEVIGTYRGIPVTVALGDNQAAFLGSVGFREDTLLLNMGTGGQVSVLSRVCCELPGIESRPFTGGRWLLVGSSLCGGRAYAVLKEFYRKCAAAFSAELTDDDVYDVMERLAWKARRNCGKERLRIRTTFEGTREDPSLRGAVGGLSEDNFTPEDLTLGVLEGMARELYDYYQSIRDGVGIHAGRIVASGNGLRRNPVLQEICGEMFGMEIGLSSCAEEAACGAAVSSLRPDA